MRARQPNFSSDGTKLVVNGEGGGRENIWEYNADGSGGRPVSDFATDQHPFYNPDANSLVVDNDKWLRSNQWLVYMRYGLNPGDRIQGLVVGENNVTDDIFDPDTPLFPLWAITHDIIFRGCDYWRQPGGGQDCGIWKKSQQFEPPVRLVSGTGIPTDTKDRKLIYMARPGGNWDVYVTSIDGGDGINITEGSTAEDGLGTISPNGQWVAFVSNREDGWGVWVAPVNGGAAQRMPINIPGWHNHYGGWTHERISWGP